MACKVAPSLSPVGCVTCARTRQSVPSRFANTVAGARFRDTETISPPYNVLITGSTKGVGLALAEEFLKAGDSVFVCSRNDASVKAVVSELSDRYGTDRVAGAACDVSKAAEVKAIVEHASTSVGDIDIWINNAGSNAYSFKPLVEADETDLVDIVQTNVLGVMICCQAAIKAMRRQKAGGHIFNMDGAGADGNPTPRFAAYGATKRSLGQLNKSLEAELKLAENNRVGIHNLSPGMVTTQLLMSGADTPQSKFFINCLAETPDVVAQKLVPRIREVPQKGRNLSTGAGMITAMLPGAWDAAGPNTRKICMYLRATGRGTRVELQFAGELACRTIRMVPPLNTGAVQGRHQVLDTCDGIHGHPITPVAWEAP